MLRMLAKSIETQEAVYYKIIKDFKAILDESSPENNLNMNTGK